MKGGGKHDRPDRELHENTYRYGLGVVACPIPAPTKGSGYRQSDFCQIDPGFWLHSWINLLVDRLYYNENDNIRQFPGIRGLWMAFVLRGL